MKKIDFFFNFTGFYAWTFLNFLARCDFIGSTDPADPPLTMALDIRDSMSQITMSNYPQNYTHNLMIERIPELCTTYVIHT